MSSPHILEFNLKFPIRIPEKWIGRSEKNSFEVLWVTVVVDEVDKSKFFILSFNSYSDVVKIVTVLIFCHVCMVMRTLLRFRESELIYYVNVSIINKRNLITFRQFFESQKGAYFFRSTQWHVWTNIIQNLNSRQLIFVSNTGNVIFFFSRALI